MMYICLQIKLGMHKVLTVIGKYILLMKRTFSRPERMRMFFKSYIKEIEQLGVNSIGIVLLISFFIGAVITIQIKLNIESAWMPRWTVGYVTREILLLEFSSAIMCLILAGKVGSNIASEIGTMRVTQQIDALEIMGVNPASFLILPKITAMMTVIPALVVFSIVSGIVGAFATCWFGGIMTATDLEYGLQYNFAEDFIWAGIIKSLFFAFIIASVSAFFGYTVTWLTDSRPCEIEDFWMDAYPVMDTLGNNVAKMNNAGYRVIKTAVLPNECWTKEFYEPQVKAQDIFLKHHPDNCTAKELVKNQRHEAELFSKYNKFYGYVWYIGEKI